MHTVAQTDTCQNWIFDLLLLTIKELLQLIVAQILFLWFTDNKVLIN